jgi:hypothetical protein
VVFPAPLWAPPIPMIMGLILTVNQKCSRKL